MKKLCIFLIFYCTVHIAFAQKQKADSLMKLLATERTDTCKAMYMWQIASYIYSFAPDSAILIAQKALFLSQHIKYKEGESRSLGQIANGFLSIGNYPRALEFYIKKLKLEEKRDNAYNLASVTMNIGIVHQYQEEYPKALYYLRRADSIITAHSLTDLQWNVNLNIGDNFDRQNNTDSAYIYFYRSMEFAKQLRNDDFLGTSLIGLGHTFFKAGNYEASLNAYKGSLALLEAANDEDLLCEATLGLAALYQKSGKHDSAIYYARYSYNLAQKDGFLSRQLSAADFLKDAYNNNTDSAFAYMKQSQALGDSINGKEKIRESQVISINEQLRQNEIAENAILAKEERSQQLQLLFIGIFIPVFFLFTLFLSRVKVHVRIINFAGILSLLILFEYLTLLLHPQVEKLTHHTPILELLIFVGIASLLIPAHHHLEKWLIEKLTQKKRSYDSNNLVIKKQKLKIKV